MTLRLPPLPTTRELIRLFGLSAKQQLSQNFLLDLNITDKIVRHAGDLTTKTVVEVGPGPGSLTRSILKARARRLIVVEKDRRFLPALELLKSAAGTIDPIIGNDQKTQETSSSERQERMHIVLEDVLQLDEESVLRRFHQPNVRWDSGLVPITVIGNLPFSISTELLLKWIRQIPTRRGLFRFGRVPFILTFQEEVAQRICASPSSVAYGRLSVMTQTFCAVRRLFDIPGECFVPAPQVNASVVYVEPLQQPLALVPSVHILEYICRQVFGQRRKTLANSIKTLGPQGAKLLALSGLDPQLRPEDLTVVQWCHLASLAAKHLRLPHEVQTVISQELRKDKLSLKKHTLER
jgi:dimethyladenosine transferase 1